MKVLVALPVEHKFYSSIDDIISGHAPVNGTDGSFIRLAALLAEAGIDVFLSAAFSFPSCHFKSLKHNDVDAEEFDHLIVHQTHWNETSLTFGNHVLAKTYLWFHLTASKMLIHTFLREGGRKVICPSQYLAKWYRMLPGWKDRVVVIPNPHSPLFHPLPASEIDAYPVSRLLFVGALCLGKGLLELTQIWSYLAQQKVPLELAIAGSIKLYYDPMVGEAGLADPNVEKSLIQPWLNSLPENYQPKFLGSLSPIQLNAEISKSWAIIVNPSYRDPETFCLSGVEAQACDRTVFSVPAGALPETIYHNTFNSLGNRDAVVSVADRIIEGLSNKERVAENGRLAGEFVRSQFGNQRICNLWIDLLKGYKIDAGLPKIGDSPGGLARDLVRWSRTWQFIHR
jgi:glycosyltransferase involved in cell wall biosynthesis